MDVRWELIDKTPVLRVRHDFPSMSEEQGIRLAGRLENTPTLKQTAMAYVDAFMRELFQSRVTLFNGQEINIKNGKLDAQILIAGESFEAIIRIERLLRYLLTSTDPTLNIKNILGAFGFDLDAQKTRKTEKFVLEGFKQGFDLIKKDTSSNIVELRDARGQRLTLMRQFTDRTSQIATQIATRKGLTMEVLGLAGLPVPRGLMVHSAAEAVSFCRQIRPGSAVIKPANTDYGIAVSTRLREENEIQRAFEIARRYGEVLAQEHIDGDDYRLLVIDGVLAGVTLREAFSITGNGRDTIRELARLKLVERGKDAFYKDYMNIHIDGSETLLTLRRQGLTLMDVPAPGVKVRLRDNSNVSSGGEHREVTDICHPDNKQLALEAASVIGLDVAGIDLLSQDISVSWKKNGAKICEINPSPAVSVDVAPQMLFRRLDTSGNSNDPDLEVGDLIYICSKDDPKKPNLDQIDEDLDELSEQQYFYQSFLAKAQRNYRFCVSPEKLVALGCPNKNMRKAIIIDPLYGVEEKIQEIRRRLPPACRIYRHNNIRL